MELAYGTNISMRVLYNFESTRKKWPIIVTNTQLVDQWVNYLNKCTHSGKYEHFAGIIT